MVPVLPAAGRPIAARTPVPLVMTPCSSSFMPSAMFSSSTCWQSAAGTGSRLPDGSVTSRIAIELQWVPRAANVA